MIDLIQPITVQQAYDGITHARRWASWNWWWRMVDDDDSDESPSPEPRTDSRSALPREIRAWWRLHLVDRDNSFSLIFSGKIGFYSVGFRVCGATRWGQPTWVRVEGGVPWWVVLPQGPPLQWFLAPIFFFYCIKILQSILFQSENFYFCTKITPWQFYWKQHQSRLVPFKSCKLESKTRAKVFGKVDTTKTYQLPKLKPLLVLKQFSW